MADNKKYYYIRLKDNFFETNEIVLLESMQDGYLYSNILLKLYLRSLKSNGKLMFNDRIPYSPQMIATITRHNVGTVEKALRIFEEMGLIEILDNGAIYMLDIQNFVGKYGMSSTDADRKREYRERIRDEKTQIGQMSGQTSTKDKYKYKDKDKYKEIILKDNTYYHIQEEDIEQYQSLYPDVDIEQEIRNMQGWCLSNPSKRKTRNGIKRFINSWLSNSQKQCKKNDTNKNEQLSIDEEFPEL